MITLDAVGKSYGRNVVLSHVSLDIAAGEIVGLAGVNGAGKTTLLDIVSGLLRPTSGRWYLEAEAGNRLAAERIARHGVVRTFQRPRLPTQATVWETLLVASSPPKAAFLALGCLSIGQGKADARLSAVVDSFGFSGDLEIQTGQLPYGRRKVFEFACRTIRNPRFFALDEPFAGVDAAGVGLIRNALLEFVRRRGAAALIAEHDSGLLGGLADRILVLDDGVLTDSLPPTGRTWTLPGSETCSPSKT